MDTLSDARRLHEVLLGAFGGTPFTRRRARGEARRYGIPEWALFEAEGAGLVRFLRNVPVQAAVYDSDNDLFRCVA